MTSPELVIDELPGGVRTLRLNRPERSNALSPTLIEALSSALDEAAADRVRVLRLEGAGERAFCSGYDLGALTAFQSQGSGTSAEGECVLPDDALGALFDKLERQSAPTVALVQGAAVGAGCELAAACDFRIGTRTARFSVPPVRLGIVYAYAGIARLTRLVGIPRAKRMFLTAAVVDAPTAHEWGLLDLVEDEADAARARTDEWCAALLRGSPLAAAGMKESFRYLQAPSLSAEQTGRLRRLRYEAFLSDDARERVQAAVEGRSSRSKLD